MPKQRSQQYKERIDNALATPKLQQALHQFGDAFLLARENAFAGHDFEALRSGIAEMKNDVRDNLDRYLQEFCSNAEAAGATIYHAATADDANDYIARLASSKGAKLAVKSKSMASEETHLNVALEKAGTKALETDLGEWIIQLAGQRPSHMVMPAIHMFKEEVAELFSKETGQEEPAEIEHLVEVARQQLRQGYLDADIGITGANIAVAETGGIALVTNEGNARLTSTLPPTHVVLVGIDKLVPTLEDAARVIQILPKNATGQLLTSYVTWIRGAVPCGDKEKDLHIVLLDNGRRTLAASPSCQDALRCIKCGACANVCPVYQTVGGHVFGHIVAQHSCHFAADVLEVPALTQRLDQGLADVVFRNLVHRGHVFPVPTFRVRSVGKDQVGQGGRLAVGHIHGHNIRNEFLVLKDLDALGAVATDVDRVVAVHHVDVRPTVATVLDLLKHFFADMVGRKG